MASYQFQNLSNSYGTFRPEQFLGNLPYKGVARDERTSYRELQKFQGGKMF